MTTQKSSETFRLRSLHGEGRHKSSTAPISRVSTRTETVFDAFQGENLT